jgi:hypothetical protein
MTVNTDKTKYIIFHPKGKIPTKQHCNRVQ